MTRYIKWQRLKEEELVKTAVCGRSVRLLLPTLLETAVLGHREPLPALITFRNTGRTCPVSRYFILAAPDAPPLLAIQRFGILYIHHIFIEVLFKSYAYGQAVPTHFGVSENTSDSQFQWTPTVGKLPITGSMLARGKCLIICTSVPACNLHIVLLYLLRRSNAGQATWIIVYFIITCVVEIHVWSLAYKLSPIQIQTSSRRPAAWNASGKSLLQSLGHP